jgi:hypothetical protein
MWSGHKFLVAATTIALGVAVIALMVLMGGLGGVPDIGAGGLKSNLTDNDAGAAMFEMSLARPGASEASCIKITHVGPAASAVHLYGTVDGALAPYLRLTVIRGTDSAPSFDSCSSFTADPADYIGRGAGVIYSDLLSEYPESFGAGIVDPSSIAPERWTDTEAHSYKLFISVANDAAWGLSSTATFTWEAGRL